MGREIRMVPPNWEHPRDCNGDYHPLYDGDYETSARDWMDECLSWEAGTHKDATEYKAEHPFYWDWDGPPPDKEYYHPKWDNATWCQVYETVSEGTPVTPPFATKEELIEYLVENGDFWDQKRGDGGWSRENATAFANRGWAPTFIINQTVEKTTIKSPRDGA
jgi:hypothetical protein